MSNALGWRPGGFRSLRVRVQATVQREDRQPLGVTVPLFLNPKSFERKDRLSPFIKRIDRDVNLFVVKFTVLIIMNIGMILAPWPYDNDHHH